MFGLFKDLASGIVSTVTEPLCTITGGHSFVPIPKSNKMVCEHCGKVVG